MAKRQFFGTFWTFVTNSLTKSFIVHKELSKMQQQKPTTRQAFQEELCATLFTVPLANPSQPPTQGHFPVPTNENDSTDKRQKASMGRKQCTLCKKTHPGSVRRARLDSAGQELLQEIPQLKKKPCIYVNKTTSEMDTESSKQTKQFELM